MPSLAASRSVDCEMGSKTEHGPTLGNEDGATIWSEVKCERARKSMVVNVKYEICEIRTTHTEKSIAMGDQSASFHRGDATLHRGFRSHEFVDVTFGDTGARRLVHELALLQWQEMPKCQGVEASRRRPEEEAGTQK